MLWLHYEDMKEDLTKVIRLVSDFLNIGVGNDELLQLVERQASEQLDILFKFPFNVGAF